MRWQVAEVNLYILKYVTPIENTFLIYLMTYSPPHKSYTVEKRDFCE
jgi:hypothetical protein